MLSVKFMSGEFPEYARKQIQEGKITNLDLRDNDFNNPLAVDQLCHLLSDPKCKLIQLVLSNCRNFCPSPMRKVVDAIIKNKKTRLRVISFLGSGVDNQGAEMVAELIENNTSLETINCNNSTFDEASLRRIEKAYEDNYYLEEFFFSSPELIDANLFIYKIIARNKFNNGFKHILSDGLQSGSSVRWGRSKLMVIGQGGAGKTSTVRALLGQTFNPNWDSTVGADLKKTDTSGWNETEVQSSDFTEAAARAVRVQQKKRIEEFKKRQVNLESIFGKMELEKAGKEEKKKKKKNGKRTTNVEKREKDEKSSFRKKEKIQTEERPEQPTVNNDVADNLYGTDDMVLDIDLEPENPENFITSHSQIKIVEEADVARRFGNKLLSHQINDESYEDPDKLTFTIWDYGGQTVFYTLHHLFLTKYGVYLLVFDMNKVFQQNKENKSEDFDVVPEAIEYLRFWINSVLLHAPDAPVLLVGTHLDSVKKLIKTEKVPLDAFYRNVNDVLLNIVRVDRHKVLVRNGKYVFFPVNNADSDGIPELRENIETSVKGKYYVDQKVPLRWVLTCDRMVEDEEFHSEWHSLQQVEGWAKECGCERKDEVSSMLKLFHELGVLIYLSSTGALRDRIVSDPQWLLNKMGMLIRDDMHGMPEHVPEHMKDEWKRLRETGIVSLTLLEELFADPKTTLKTLTRDKLESRSKDTDFLVDLMQHAMLLSDWAWSDNVNDKNYVVPSLLKSTAAKNDVVNKRLAAHKNPATLYVDFSKFFLPVGVFQRFVCMLINMVGKLSPGKENDIDEPLLGADFAFVSLKKQNHATKANNNSKQKTKKIEKRKSSSNKNKDVKDVEEMEEGDNNIEIFLHVIEKDRIQMIVNDDKLAPQCLNMMLALIRKLREEVMGSRLKMEIWLTRIVNGEQEATTGSKTQELEYYAAKGNPDFQFWFKGNEGGSAKVKKVEKKTPTTDIDNFLLSILE
eukprot:CAMPEP_0204824340 /NCGR_PEP_ID=MMETSP1346-20131115/2366_1 /ASSEMBLY_ACC=CAM_ASM_000771 /TAXON_ID=215587 /ORGANISM="Aplanochytrium stocchinoi, Strain GSBS06" /LENGTH=963 /DNA_ID=CAMNT_0051951435 /DNA_START=109 /DNA_END=3000 /DNA_ORIENTATION=+